MRRIRRISAWILTLAILLTLTVPALAASSVQNEVQGSAAYMVSAVKAPEVGSIGGEWAIIGLARSGYTVPTNYHEDYYARVEKYVKNCSGVLHERKYTEYSRVILALTAIGRDPSKVAGYNLLTPLGDFEKTIWQGMNGPIWALIALDSGNYDIPKNPAAKTQATRQLYIDEILNNQMKDGGWSLTGTGDSDVDISAMALQALAKYQDQKAVKTATDKALTAFLWGTRAQLFWDGNKRTSMTLANKILIASGAGILTVTDRHMERFNTLLLGYYDTGEGEELKRYLYENAIFGIE